MSKPKAQISKHVETVLDQQAGATENRANKLRWWFIVVFGVAAAWTWNSGSSAKYTYTMLSVSWLITALMMKAKLKRANSALPVMIDVTIINLGLLLCWGTGAFATHAPEIFLCYFPVLGLAATRYKLGLVIKASLYGIIFYTLMASFAVGVPWIQLAMLAAMMMVAVSIARQPKGLVMQAAADAAEESYALGVKEREVELAGQVQDALLGREMAAVSGLWVVAKHEAGLKTGGDYYSVFETKQGPLVIVGDLGGQGIEATLAVAQLHRLLSSIILRESQLPRILEELNTALWQLYHGTRQLTCVLARWEGEQLHYINAGHLPAIHLDKQQQRSQLPVTCGPVGASEQANFIEETSTFPARELLLLYTDGLYSEATPDRQAGIAEVERMTDQFSHSEVNTVCYRVFDCCKPHRDIPQDDRTLVVVRRQPSAFEKAGQEAPTGAAA